MKTTDAFIEDALVAVGVNLGSDASTRELFGEVIMAGADWLRAIGGETLPNQVMERLVRWAFGRNNQSEVMDSWFGHPPRWDNVDEMHTADWIWAQRFKTLRGYAECGLYRRPSLGSKDPYQSVIPSDLGSAENLLHLLPVEWLRTETLLTDYHCLWLVFGKARARFRLDQGEDLAFNDIVLLSGMNPKSVRNATQQRHGSRRLQVAAGDIVKNTDAVAWLLDRKKRKTFVPTPDASYEPPPKSYFDPDDVVFIPLSADGRPFEPASAAHSQCFSPMYHICIDGEDADGEVITYFDDYFEALRAMIGAKAFGWIFKDGSTPTYGGWQRASRAELRRQEKKALEERRVFDNKIENQTRIDMREMQDETELRQSPRLGE